LLLTLLPKLKLDLTLKKSDHIETELDLRFNCSL